jgi:hypothetical protein
MPSEEQALTVANLVTGDRASAYITGLLVANAFKESKIVVLGQNVLGQVVLINPNQVHIEGSVLLPDAVLNGFDEETAMALMVKEGRNEDDIIEYLKRREGPPSE